MEKALLNITRFNSADVIATSGEKNYPDHYGRFMNVETGKDVLSKYTYDSTKNEWKFAGMTELNAGHGFLYNKWYLNPDDPSSICTDSSHNHDEIGKNIG